MARFGWLRSFWNAIKGNFYYDILTRLLVLLGGSAMLATAWKWMQTVRGQNGLDPLGLSILGCLILCSFLLVFLSFRHTPTDYSPDFRFDVGAMIWIFDAEKNQTLFFPIARILNRGHPSVTTNWKAAYKISGHHEAMKPLWLRGSYTLDVGEESLTIENQDLLNAKTAENPVPRGGVASGRLLFVLPGDRSAQIKALQHTIEYSCEDYLGTVYSATYKPSSEPLTVLLTLPHEKGAFKKRADEKAPEKPLIPTEGNE